MGKQLDLRDRVYRFYIEHKNKGKMFTIDHFKAENEHDKTIRRIIERIENGIPMDHQRKYAQSTLKMSDAKLDQLKDLFENQCKISQRQAAARLKISASYVCRTLKKKTKIKCYKKKAIPKRTNRQKQEGRTKCATIFRTTKDVEIVMDDESYFTLSHSTIGGNDKFYSSNPKLAPAAVKFRTKSKFEKKALVWLAMSQRASQNYISYQVAWLSTNKSTRISVFDVDSFLSFVQIILTTITSSGLT